MPRESLDELEQEARGRVVALLRDLMENDSVQLVVEVVLMKLLRRDSGAGTPPVVR
jgi:hypothetical protein